MEKMPSGKTATENKETRVSRSYELKDTKGKLICRTEIAFDPADTITAAYPDLNGNKVQARRVSALKIFSPDGQEIDLLSLYPSLKQGSSLYVADTELISYCHQNVNRQTFIPIPENPIQLATIFHEMGHSDQNLETRFKQLLDLRRAVPRVLQSELVKITDEDPERSLDSVLKNAALIKKAYPELAKAYNPHQVRQSVEAYIADIAPLRQQILDTKRLQKEHFISNFFSKIKANLQSLQLIQADEVATEQDLIAALQKMDIHMELLEGNMDSENISDLIKALRGASLDELTFNDTSSEIKINVPYFSEYRSNTNHFAYLKTSFTTTEFQKFIEDQKSFDARIKLLQQTIKDIEKNRPEDKREQFRREMEPINALADFPTRMIERDANYRALTMMRRLKKQYGIDLFVAISDDCTKRYSKVQESCSKLAEQLIQYGEKPTPLTIDAHTDFIKRSLASYGATTPELRRAFGKIPRPRERPDPDDNS